MKKGHAGTMTHDYKRNGNTTLFAALDVAAGTVIGECLARHRTDEFLSFLKTIDRETPAHLDLHLILDNYATHKTPAVKRWLRDTNASHCTSRRHPVPGSTSSSGSLPKSLASASDEEPSTTSSNSRPRLTSGSSIETKTQSPSSGPPAPNPSSQSTAEPKKRSPSQKRDANK